MAGDMEALIEDLTFDEKAEYCLSSEDSMLGTLSADKPVTLVCSGWI